MTAPAPTDRRRQVHLVEFTVLPGLRHSCVLGYLHAAAAADPVLAAACTFRKHVRMQAGPHLERACTDILDSLDDPLAVAFTVYFWNRPASLELARRIKQRWPDCRIVLGGNDVTHQQDAVFAEAPWTDILVHGEGELRFPAVLRRLLDHPEAPDLTGIDGISHRTPDGRLRTTPDAPRVADLAAIPSPLLTPGIWSDEDLAGSRMIVYETNRGCPYSCAFCFWGGATNSRVRRFDTERIRAELDRIVATAAPGTQLFIADANFGILPRDADIARHLVDRCREHRTRLLVTTNWAKNTNGRVVEIAGTLHRAGLTGAITLSTQSFDPEVLEIAHRRNIRTDAYRRMQTAFREQSIPTYTDLIWGLPGESRAVHLAGIEEAIASGGSPVVYPLLLLNNTEYSHERFRDEHGLRARRMPCDPGSTQLPADVVVTHSRMGFDDWLQGMAFRIPLTLYHKCLLRATLRILAHVSGARTVDLVELLGGRLREGGTDPVIGCLLAGYERCWTEPESFEQAFLYRQIGHPERPVIHEEVHYQAILRRMVDTPERARAHVRDAVDHLYAALAEQGRPLPERASLDRVAELDLAAAAVFRAGLHGRAERAEVRVPDEHLAVLREFGDIPREAAPAAPGDAPTALLSVVVPQARTRYPFSAYALSVWHGSGRPLFDAGTAAVHTDAAQPA